MLPPFDLPDEIFLLVTDELASPADFVLHRALAAQLKVSNVARSSTSQNGSTVGAQAIVLSVSEPLARWTAIASKSNVNIQTHISSGNLSFIDVLSHIQPPLKLPTSTDSSTVQPALRPIFDLLTPLLGIDQKGDAGAQTSTKTPLVILDDLTTLSWLGFSTTDLTRFVRALKVACRKANATLIVRHHVVTPGRLDDLSRELLQLCSYHLEVKPLSSGKSGSVSGEVALHLGLTTAPGSVKLIPRRTAMHYRLTDIGVTFFDRGTSGGVL